jgi:M6 family metalloprotease-like protein
MAITTVLLALSLLVWRVSSTIHSTVPANPLPFESKQPDGSKTPLLQFWGDGTDNYLTDESGFVVVENEGWFVYAQEDSNGSEQDATTEGSLRARRLEASPARNMLTPSQHVVGSIDPSTVSGLTTVAQRKHHSQQHRRLQQSIVDTTSPNQRKLYTDTTFQSLILLLRFADHTDRELPTSAQFVKFFNKKDLSLIINDIAPTGSVHELFWDNSYGSLDMNAVVTDWITLSETEEYYANGEYGFQRLVYGIHEALSQVFEGQELEGINKIDGLGILHSGYGAEYAGKDCFNQKNVNRIWSHQAGSLGFVNPLSNFVTGGNQTEGIASLVVPDRYFVASALRNKCGSDITRIGIVAHEMGHFLGLPDLYDKTFDGNGCGNYDPMSKSWGEWHDIRLLYSVLCDIITNKMIIMLSCHAGWDGTGLYPPIFSAWSKMTLGWLKPLEITANGQYFIGSSANVPQVYIIRKGFADGEYLLIENRQPEGFDSQLKGGGIAVWHIDEHASDQRGFLGQDGYPFNGNHYKVALLQADGDQHLERGTNNGDASDLWHKDSEFTVLGPSSSTGTVVQDAEKYTVPNTDSNRHGNVTISGIWIHNFTASGEYMGFTVHGLGINVNASKGFPHPSVSKVDISFTTSPPTSTPTAVKRVPSPTTSPTASSSPSTEPPTITSPPSVDPWTVFKYYPDWLYLGCKRKSLAEFSSWEKNKYDSIGDCCDKSMPWTYSSCVQASVRLMGLSLTQAQIEGAAPIQMSVGHNGHEADVPP